MRWLMHAVLLTQYDIKNINRAILVDLQQKHLKLGTSVRSKKKISNLIIWLFEVSLISVGQVDYLDTLHLGVSRPHVISFVLATSTFYGYSSTALFLFIQFTPLKYLITSRRVLTTLFTPDNVKKFTITLVRGRYLTNIRTGIGLDTNTRIFFEIFRKFWDV